jgi:hypothetical protein
MIETKNTLIYNRYKYYIELIHNHTNILVEETVIDKKDNVEFSFDFKSTYEERKHTNFWDFKNHQKKCWKLI